MRDLLNNSRFFFLQNKCYTHNMNAFNMNRRISKQDAQKLAPALIYMQLQGLCGQTKMSEVRIGLEPTPTVTNVESITLQFFIEMINYFLSYYLLKITPKTNCFCTEYGYGSIAIFIISVLALLGIVLLPCFDKHYYQNILKALTALAASTLFSDAMLHILPDVCVLVARKIPH